MGVSLLGVPGIALEQTDVLLIRIPYWKTRESSQISRIIININNFG